MASIKRAMKGRGPAKRDDRTYLKDEGSPNDPNVEQLKEEFMYALNERDSSVFARARLNHDTRFCVWPGQSEDGRKWSPRLGEDEVFPWSGASDARVNLVDLYVRKHVAMLMTLWGKMKTTVNGTEVNDEAWARRLTDLIRWMKYTQMSEARRENELLANYMCERGSAVMGVKWAKERTMAYQELDQENVLIRCAQLAQAPGGAATFADLPAMLQDPSMEGEAAELLGKLLQQDDDSNTGLNGDQAVPAPALSSKRLEQVVADLRQAGYARFPRPTVTMNRPKVVALCPNDDVFISPDAYRMEDATVFHVEVMREAKLRAMAKSYNWDAQWTEQMVETQKGNVEFGGLLFNQRMNRNASWLVPSRGQLDVRKLYLVVHAYRRLADADGVPGIYYTVFNPHLVDNKDSRSLQYRYGMHELLNYDHGKMPYVLLQPERRSRKIDDARGYGEVANTWQSQVKAEWDNRIDRSSIATLPPSYYPQGQQPDKWGPGVQVPTSQPDRYGFYEVPGDPAGSREVEESVRQYADEYFGFRMDQEHAVDSMALRQKLADDWFAGQSEVDTQVLQLCQQFMPDSFYYRVVGSSKGKPIHCTREEIQGQFDVKIGYNVQDLDPEVVKEKMQLLQQALAMDINGIIDRNEALVVTFEMIDPNLGERLLKPADNASMAEVEDEQSVALKLLKGIAVPVKPGQAYQLRLQVLQNLFQQNAAAQRDLQSNPQAQQAVQQRVKDLGFQVQQQQNAVIGRGGPEFAAKPAGR